MKHSLRIAVLIIIAALGLLFLQRQPRQIDIPREETWTVMGTVASLKTPGTARPHFPEMLALAKDIFDEVNTHLSVYVPTSELSRLNQNGILKPATELTREFLQITTQMTTRSQNFFDTSLLPVIQLWGFSGGKTPVHIPTDQQINQALQRTTIHELLIDESGAYFPQTPGHIDPGGIAKGFALDRAFIKLRETFPDADFLLNLGGEMRVQGHAAPHRGWRIAVQHPFEQGATIGVVNVPSGFAIATSGHYERYVELAGTRYAHIIDPATGWPVQGMAGVTVLCPNATEADVLSTALFVAGITQAQMLLRSFPDSHALLIPDREPLQIYLSSRMADWFEPTPQYRNSILLLSDIEM
ncbi:MAG: FAD:protein FMN transferase [Kiritimatiellia bacterium]